MRRLDQAPREDRRGTKICLFRTTARYHRWCLRPRRSKYARLPRRSGISRHPRRMRHPLPSGKRTAGSGAAPGSNGRFANIPARSRQLFCTPPTITLILGCKAKKRCQRGRGRAAFLPSGVLTTNVADCRGLTLMEVNETRLATSSRLAGFLPCRGTAQPGRPHPRDWPDLHIPFIAAGTRRVFATRLAPTAGQVVTQSQSGSPPPDSAVRILHAQPDSRVSTAIRGRACGALLRRHHAEEFQRCPRARARGR
jgi:hypothetical protein